MPSMRTQLLRRALWRKAKNVSLFAAIGLSAVAFIFAVVFAQVSFRDKCAAAGGVPLHSICFKKDVTIEVPR